jgi:LPS-assembly lipoprotein
MIKRNLLVMGLAVLLSACGFQLRGTGTNQLTITELDVSARNAYGDTVRQLRQVLENSGVKITPNAPYKLVLTDEKETQRAASYTGNTGTAEYQLNSVVNYEIQGQNHLVLLSDKVEAYKVYLQDGSNVAGSNQEGVMIRKEIRRDLIQQLVLRLEQLTRPSWKNCSSKRKRRPRLKPTPSKLRARLKRKLLNSRLSNCKTSKAYGALKRPAIVMAL